MAQDSIAEEELAREPAGRVDEEERRAATLFKLKLRLLKFCQ